jgi:hypothetical protein
MCILGEFIILMAINTITVGLNLLNPILINALIHYIQDDPKAHHKGGFETGISLVLALIGN